MGAAAFKPLLSDKKISIGGTLLQACRSHALMGRINREDSPPPKPSDPGEDFGAPNPGRKPKGISASSF